MAGSQIGLSAVMEMAGFTQGINKYNQMVAGASSNTEKHAGIMTRALAGIGKTMKIAAAGAVGGITAIVGAMVAGTAATISWAEKLDSVGDVLGTTAEESAALAVAAQHIGGNVEQLSSQLAILTRGLFNAKGEIGPTGLVLKDLGIAFQDANGKMLPTTTILQSVADKIGIMPDGLEKTQIMMDLFGKSGKDMSDMMGVLANGGMEAMNQKAKDLGLSMSDDAVNGAIELNRAFKDLKMMGQGLLVTLGTALLPILGPLVKGFGELAMRGVEFLREKIQLLTPFLQSVVAWLSTHIPLAVGIAETFFNNHLRQPLESIRDFIRDHVIPRFVDVYNWLLTNIPLAIGTAETFFNEHLKQPLIDVRDFIKDHVIPRFSDVYNWLLTNIPLAIAQAEAWFNQHLLGPLTAVRDFIRDNVIPKFSDVYTWLLVNIPLAITQTEAWINNHLIPAFVNSTASIKTWYDDAKPKIEEILGKFSENDIRGGLADLGKILTDWFATIDWKKLGESINFTDKFSKWCETVDWTKVGGIIGFGLGKAIGSISLGALGLNQKFIDALAASDWGTIGKCLWDGFVKGMNLRFELFKDGWKVVLGLLVGFFTGYDFGAQATAFWNGFVSSMKLRWDLFKGSWVWIFNKFIEGLSVTGELAGYVIQIGKRIVEIIINEINKGAGGIWSAVLHALLGGGEPGTGGGGKGKVGTGKKLGPDTFQGGPDNFQGGLLTNLIRKIVDDIFSKLSNSALRTPGMAGALTGFAGVILGRFQSTITGPMEEQQQELADVIASLEEKLAATTDPQEAYWIAMNLETQQKRYAELTEKLNIEKEHELELQKQLNDLAYLQAQMDFVQFLAENSLSISDILGNLELGLGLDLPAFMDAITRALTLLVAQLGVQVGPPGETPGTPTAPGFAGQGFGGGNGNAVYNNQSVIINVNATLNNGWDAERLGTFILDKVTGALR